MSESKGTILVLFPAATGHITVVAGIIREIVKRSNFRVVFYSTLKYKNIVELTGAEYRQYCGNEKFDKFFELNDEKKSLVSYESYKNLMNASADELPFLIEACHELKPKIIIYDFISIPARYLFCCLKELNKKGQLDYHLPKEVNVCSSIAWLENVFPSQAELETMFDHSVFTHEFVEKIFYVQQEINKKYGIDYLFDISSAFRVSNDLNLSSLIQELQPKNEILKDKYKFIGCCTLEPLKKSELIQDENLIKVLESFQEINPIDLNKTVVQNKKLIYASLGTIFNFDISTYEKIIDSVRLINQEAQNDHDDDLLVVLSVGKQVCEIYDQKIKNQNYQMPNNVRLFASVPQIEILKRASLFITHCGTNSVNESIHFGVPFISLPQESDQILIGYRISEELKFGIRLDTKNFSPHELKYSIKQVLNDKIYLNNVLEFSKISRKQNGCVNGANIILDYLNSLN